MFVSKDVDEAAREFKRFRKEPEKKVRTMTDGNGKYYVAHGDDELIQRLHDGLKLTKALNGEKFLLQHR